MEPGGPAVTVRPAVTVHGWIINKEKWKRKRSKSKPTRSQPSDLPSDCPLPPLASLFVHFNLISRHRIDTEYTFLIDQAKTITIDQHLTENTPSSQTTNPDKPSLQPLYITYLHHNLSTSPIYITYLHHLSTSPNQRHLSTSTHHTSPPIHAHN